MKDMRVSVDGLRWYKPNGRYIEEIWYSEAINEIVAQGQDKRILKTFTAIRTAAATDMIDTVRANTYELLDRLKQVVEDILVEVGWDVHIVDPLKRTEAEDYIHNAGFELRVHEVPFSPETNIELKLDELCNGEGKIRSKEETLALLKERIGADAFDIRELSEEDRGYVLAIMRQEKRDLEDLHDVDGQELTTGAQTFKWFRDDEEGEDKAREYLTDDDELWKMTVAAGNTTDGLEEWAEDAIRIDGWAQVIGGYDGRERVAELKDGTWFPYIRTN
jgi:hypothetical protein